jgi:RNA polymerase sigma factor (sigma-70 family)
MTNEQEIQQILNSNPHPRDGHLVHVDPHTMPLLLDTQDLSLADLQPSGIDKEDRELFGKINFTEKQQDILELYYYDGLTESSIGEIHGITKSAVSSNLKTIRKKIAKYFAEQTGKESRV